MSAPTILPTAGFSTIDNDILLNPKISIEAKATLTLLKYFDRGTGRGCFARKETLCRFLAISPYRLRKALAELKDLGLITITRPGQGHPDIIRVVRQERQQGPQPLQVEVELQEELDQVAEELQEEELDHVVDEPPEVTPADLPEPLDKSDDSDSQDVEILIGEISSGKHYKNKINLNNINTLNPCDEKELISFYYESKEDRQPTQNEIANWTSTARRLLKEFTLEELKPAVENAIAKGARLFYFVALTAPAFIIGQRQQQEAELHREREAEKGRGEEEGRDLRWAERKATAYASETADLIEALSQHIRPQILRSFFSDTFISFADERSITLAVPSETIANWIRERYMSLLSEVVGREVKVISA